MNTELFQYINPKLQHAEVRWAWSAENNGLKIVAIMKSREERTLPSIAIDILFHIFSRNCSRYQSFDIIKKPTLLMSDVKSKHWKFQIWAPWLKFARIKDGILSDRIEMQKADSETNFLEIRRCWRELGKIEFLVLITSSQILSINFAFTFNDLRCHILLVFFFCFCSVSYWFSYRREIFQNPSSSSAHHQLFFVVWRFSDQSLFRASMTTHELSYQWNIIVFWNI